MKEKLFKHTGRIFDYLSSKAPTTVDAAIPMIVKTIGIIAAIIILIILLAKFL